MMRESGQRSVKFTDVMMYVGVALQHLRLMLLVLAFSLLLGLTYYCYARPVFYSKSLVRVQTIAQTVDTESEFRDSNLRTIQAMLNSPQIAERAAKRLGYHASAREIDSKFIKKVRILGNSEGNLELEVWPYKYELARDWPEALVDEYLLYRDEMRQARKQVLLARLKQDVVDEKAQVEELSGRKLEHYNSNELALVEVKLDELREVPAQIAINDHQLGKMEDAKKRLAAAAKPEDKLTVLKNLQQDLPSLTGLQMQMVGGSTHSAQVIVMPSDTNAKNEKWEQLAMDAEHVRQDMLEKGQKFLPGHTVMRALQAKLDDIQRQLEGDYQVAKRQFDILYENLRTDQTNLQAKLPEFTATQQRLTELENAGKNLDAQTLPWQQLLNNDAKAIVALAYGSEKERTQLEYAGFLEPVSTHPASPNRGRLVMMFLGMGFLLAIALPFGLTYLDSSVSDLDEAEQSLRIRGLGVVPKVEESSLSNLLVSAIDARPTAKAEYHLQENFRIIRTNLIMNSESPTYPQVVLVTSSMPQEGKTVVSSSLAMSFSAKGEKTLLVDADLRRGRLHQVFGCENKPGLSDVLSGYHTLAEACRPTGREHLTLLSCGKHLNWASELLDTQRFARIIEELRGQYQRIVIDTPPVLGLSETSIMQRHSDGVLMVIWSSHTQMNSIQDGLAALQANGAKILGFVLNRMDFSAFSNRYKYFYYSPRYYTNYKAIEASALVGTDR